MKFIFITCNISIKQEVIEIIEKADVSDYQVIDHVTAKPVVGDPRFDTDVWPGYNCLITLQVREHEKAKTIIQNLKEFNAKKAFNESELITLASWEMEEYFFN